jgi:hypothetical protein
MTYYHNYSPLFLYLLECVWYDRSLHLEATQRGAVLRSSQKMIAQAYSQSHQRQALSHQGNEDPESKTISDMEISGSDIEKLPRW